MTILANQDDLHSLAVHHSLMDRGFNSRIISLTDLPGFAVGSIEYSDRVIQSSWEDCISGQYQMPAGIYWNRRRIGGPLPEEIDRRDRRFAYRSNQVFFRWFAVPDLLGGHWVNDPILAVKADNKLLQLKMAQEAGLSIPKTLVSNDPNKIEQFLSVPSASGYIVKPVIFGSWKEDGLLNVPFTAEIELSDIEGPMQLRGAPMIYQEKIEKISELRVIVLGQDVIAAEIDSQSQANAKTDWRVDMSGHAAIRPYRLPPGIRKKILNLTRSLQLEFAAIDMAVGMDSELVFFEVNEMGQFLWLEEQCPELRLLKLACSYFGKCIMGDSYDESLFEDVQFSDFCHPDWKTSWERANSKKYQEVVYETF